VDEEESGPDVDAIITEEAAAGQETGRHVQKRGS